MSSVNDIMAVLLDDTTKAAVTTNNKLGRGRPGRPATRGSKQINSSSTITSKPTDSPSPAYQQMGNKQTNNRKQGVIGPAQISRLQQNFVKV